jgi:hypothetical protein
MEYLVGIIISFTIINFVISTISGYCAYRAWVEIEASRKSTHNIQYVPVESMVADKDLNKELRKNEEKYVNGDREDDLDEEI